jgi:hypothetical protein
MTSVADTSSLLTPHEAALLLKVSRETVYRLTRSDLRELGYQRRAVDAVFRACPVVVLPGYSRPLIRVSDYTSFLERCTYDGRSRVR